MRLIGSKWVTVHHELKGCQHAYKGGDIQKALEHARNARDKAVSHCVNQRSKRSMGQTLFRIIDADVVGPLSHPHIKPAQKIRVVLGSISTILEIVEREAGVGLYRKISVSDDKNTHFLDSLTERMFEDFEKRIDRNFARIERIRK